MNQTYLKDLPDHIDAGTLVTIVPCSPPLEGATVYIDEFNQIVTTPNLVVAWEIFNSGLSMPVYAWIEMHDDDYQCIHKIGETWFKSTYQGVIVYESLTQCATEHLGNVLSRRALIAKSNLE